MPDLRCICGYLASAHLLAELECSGFTEADPTDFIDTSTANFQETS